MNNFQKLSGKLHPNLLQDTQDKRRDSARPYGRPEFQEEGIFPENEMGASRPLSSPNAFRTIRVLPVVQKLKDLKGYNPFCRSCTFRLSLRADVRVFRRLKAESLITL